MNKDYKLSLERNVYFYKNYAINFYDDLKNEINEKEELENKLDLIYDYIDDLLSRGEFEVCDKILEDFNPDDWDDASIHLSFLTITFVAKNKLKNRGSCYSKIKSNFEKQYSKDKIEAMLMGLE